MVSSELIDEVLQGLTYPADRAEVIRHATVRGAPDRVLKVLDAIPEREYVNRDDIWREISPQHGA